jgi:DNA-3-methyladenine glycosylase
LKDRVSRRTMQHQQFPRLTAHFYQRTDVVKVAQELLGKVLVTELEGVRTSGIICETEAYRAPDDKACHAYQNRRTARTEVMFWPGGHAYIYLCYGIHHLFNVVTGPTDAAHAVLVRGIVPLEGVNTMLQRRNMPRQRPNLSAGPGTLSAALGLHTRLTGLNMLSPESPVWIEDRGIVPAGMEATPRIGVDYAAECAAWLWRFVVTNY